MRDQDAGSEHCLWCRSLRTSGGICVRVVAAQMHRQARPTAGSPVVCVGVDGAAVSSGSGRPGVVILGWSGGMDTCSRPTASDVCMRLLGWLALVAFVLMVRPLALLRRPRGRRRGRWAPSAHVDCGSSCGGSGAQGLGGLFAGEGTPKGIL